MSKKVDEIFKFTVILASYSNSHQSVCSTADIYKPKKLKFDTSPKGTLQNTPQMINADLYYETSSNFTQPTPFPPTSPNIPKSK
jgi:hypothetical protein